MDVRSFNVTPVSHFVKAEPLDKIFFSKKIQHIQHGRNLRQGGRNLINHGHQIEKEIPGSNPMRNFSLPTRTATTWNILPSEVVRSDNVDIFKKRIDEHMRSPKQNF